MFCDACYVLCVKNCECSILNMSKIVINAMSQFDFHVIVIVIIMCPCHSDQLLMRPKVIIAPKALIVTWLRPRERGTNIVTDRGCPRHLKKI